jgi:hypothetical protein
VLGGGKIFLRPLFLTEISLHHACSCHKLEDGNAWAGKFFLLRMVESAGLAIGFYMETWGWCRTSPCRQPRGGCPRSATPELLTEDSLGLGGGGGLGAGVIVPTRVPGTTNTWTTTTAECTPRPSIRDTAASTACVSTPAPPTAAPPERRGGGARRAASGRWSARHRGWRS